MNIVSLTAANINIENQKRIKQQSSMVQPIFRSTFNTTKQDNKNKNLKK